ncbi:histone-lysine N-methyltransferase ATXR6 [Canna indica]|uniref:[histone H3]-lysine(27) N-methyltransferase n=1 Tax=Canna indica TaxID=4628 RepID=A0AAQ3QRX8_9LILI|nr:histone-lysine N-methyltransferase ATXR6 [Canna indica]
MAPRTPFRKRTHAAPDAPNSAADDLDRFDSIQCEKCRSGDCPDELLLCDKCDRGFHIFCLRPILVSVPKGLWFCPSCSADKKPKRESTLDPVSSLSLSLYIYIYIYTHTLSRSVGLFAEFPLVQTKIVDFFRIQRSSAGEETSGCRKRKKRNGGLVMAKKKRKLLPFNPIEDPNRRLEQMASLATALTATGAVFSNELTYRPGMAPRSANCARLEKGGMQVLSKEDNETLNQCKKMMEMGEWPPLMVVYDPLEGFTVEADRYIKDLTIVTEYVGDVDYLKNREHDDGDSMMTLLSATDAPKSLVICPDQRSNIARFINGINNHTREGKKKQNLKCVRYSVDGECRVLLIANRDITKGERLYYDYNGSEQEYPTEHFV